MSSIIVSILPSWAHAESEKNLEIEGTQIRVVYGRADKNADIVCDKGTPFNPKSKQCNPEKRIFIPTEPSLILGLNKNLAGQISQYYKKKILAWHPLLKDYPQTQIFTAPQCWFYEKILPEDKMFGISGLISAKNNARMQGYQIRRKILAEENKIKIPSMVWNFRKQWQGKPHIYPTRGKYAAMKYMYHFAIENCSEDGYFTEKVIDCFMSYTVPVYWGDQSICSKFDPGGIIKLRPGDMAAQVNALSEEDYERRMPAVINNRKIIGDMITPEYLMRNILGLPKGE